MGMLLWACAGAALTIAMVLMYNRWATFPAQRPEDYSGVATCFDLREQLDGELQCEGVIYGPLGRVNTRFVADFSAHWEGDHGVMRERFTYDDGTCQDREWHLQLDGQGNITARADDVVGQGRGRQMGDAVQMRYRLRLPDASGGYVLDAVDWMYLAPNGAIINRSQFRKFGIRVAELIATIRRKPN